MRPFSVRVYMYSVFQPFLRRCEQNDRTSSAFLKTSGQAKHDPNFPIPLFTIRYTGSSTGESIVRIARIKICRSLPEAEKEGNGESGRAFRRTNLRVSPVRDGARAFERFEERLAPTADRLSRNKRKCQKTYEGIFQKNDPRDRRGGNNERRPQRCAA